MDLIESFLTYVGSENGERAVNVVLAVLTAIAAVVLWMFGVIGKTIALIFPKKKPDQPNPSPTYQIVNQGVPKGEIQLSIAEFTAYLESERNKTEAKLKTAHDDERAALTKKVAELQRQTKNPKAALEEANKRIADLEALLERSGNDIGGDRISTAKAALAKGDYSFADSVFAEIAARNELAVKETARANFGRGEIAEAEFRMDDAAKHFSKSASLDPTIESLKRAHRAVMISEAYDDAFQLSTELVNVARKESGQGNLSMALCAHARTLLALGRDDEAEEVCREALEIDRATIGEWHYDYAAHLNFLAKVLEGQRRYDEAKVLYREALEIDRLGIESIGSSYKTHLNGLADMVERQGRHKEAEELYRETIQVYRPTAGSEHSDYFYYVEGLAILLEEQGRYEEAEGQYRELLEIDSARLLDEHLDHANYLFNIAALMFKQDRPAEARPVFERALALFRETLSPDDPHLAFVEAYIADLPKP